MCWRDSFGQPLNPKTTVENLGITDEDLLPPVPRKQRGRPKRVHPTIESVNPEIMSKQNVRDVVSEIMVDIVDKLVKEERTNVVISSDELPFSTVPENEFKSTFQKCHVNMARKLQRVQEHFEENPDPFLKHPQSHASMTRAKAEYTKTLIITACMRLFIFIMIIVNNACVVIAVVWMTHRPTLRMSSQYPAKALNVLRKWSVLLKVY